MTNLALVSCVHNEEDFLPAFLTYHRALGVSRAYIFTDRCTDNTDRILDEFSWITKIPVDRTKKDLTLEQMQVVCVNQAMGLAQQEHMDWLIHIDADEFVWAGNEGKDLIEQASLEKLLNERINQDTEVVQLMPWELLPTETAIENFWAMRYVIKEGYLERTIYDPLKNEHHVLKRNFGHSFGKAIARVSADLITDTGANWLHKKRWYQFGNAPPVKKQKIGNLFHYVIISAQQWYKKFKALADSTEEYWLPGRAVPLYRLIWRRLCLAYTQQEAEDYYNQWLRLSDQELQDYLAAGRIAKSSQVEDLLTQIGFIK